MKILAPHANASITPIKSALFILHPWTLKQRQDGSWQAIRDYITHYRANPRTAEYMLELAGQFAHRHAVGATIDLLAEEKLSPELLEKTSTWATHILPDLSLSEANKYDTAVLLYHDPIGLGWEDLERKLLKLNAVQYIVINGRRREFIWDQESRRMLAFRRFLARAGWLEVLLVPWLWVVAIFFYLSDVLTGRKRKEA